MVYQAYQKYRATQADPSVVGAYIDQGIGATAGVNIPIPRNVARPNQRTPDILIRPAQPTLGGALVTPIDNYGCLPLLKAEVEGAPAVNGKGLSDEECAELKSQVKEIDELAKQGKVNTQTDPAGRLPNRGRNDTQGYKREYRKAGSPRGELTESKPSIDHIVPYSWGGAEYDPYNMRPIDENLNKKLGSRLANALKDMLKSKMGTRKPKNTKIKITGADVEGC